MFTARGHVAYRANIDLTLTVTPWQGTSLLVYGENGYGDGVTEAADVDTPISNLEAPDFTQLSEIWLEQTLAGGRVRLRLGKQDANRDFGEPRFPGNFVNSSFGVIPTVPIPSFPAPGWGALAAAQAGPVELRAAIYEAAPEVESLALHTGGGAIGVVALFVRHAIGTTQPPAGGVHQIGAWLSPAGSGLFAVVDTQVLFTPPLSVQAFARAGWSPDTGSYIGAGFTYHGMWGRNYTLGLGGGWMDLERSEGFCELFYKLRFGSWMTIEPDGQVYTNGAVIAGVRGKLKL